jgi:hypothetical protein
VILSVIGLFGVVLLPAAPSSQMTRVCPQEVSHRLDRHIDVALFVLGRHERSVHVAAVKVDLASSQEMTELSIEAINIRAPCGGRVPVVPNRPRSEVHAPHRTEALADRTQT